MKTLLKLLLTALAVMVLAHWLPGVHVESYGTSVLVALILAVLRFVVKPILVILTLPITIITLGLFLFIINALIILLGASLIDGFDVDGIWRALLFSILLSLFESLLFSLIKED